jgi:hypothetical protein
MDPWDPSINHLGRDQFWQVLQPQTGGLDLAVTEHPWLDYLVWLAYHRRNNRHGIFKSNPFNGCRQKPTNEVQSFGLLILLVLEPSGTTDSQMRAWRVGDHQVPSIAQQLEYIALEVMLAAIFGRQKITRPCVMP